MRGSGLVCCTIFIQRERPGEEIKRAKGAYEEWKRAAANMLRDCPPSLPGPPKRLSVLLTQMRLKWGAGAPKLEPIDLITRCWLRAKDIQYDGLTIERGSEDVSDPRGQVRNRFYVSRKKRIRFFVEDVAEKANKLAYICDVVFLLDHPYNQGQEFPENVVRVQSWDEIYRQIRRLS